MVLKLQGNINAGCGFDRVQLKNCGQMSLLHHSALMDSSICHLMGRKPREKLLHLDAVMQAVCPCDSDAIQLESYSN